MTAEEPQYEAEFLGGPLCGQTRAIVEHVPQIAFPLSVALGTIAGKMWHVQPHHTLVLVTYGQQAGQTSDRRTYVCLGES